MSYCVVEFLGADDEPDQEIAVVPSIWLTKQDHKCFWPNRIGQKTYKQFVLEQPTPKTTWPKYTVYKVHFRTDDYQNADNFITAMEADTNNTSCSASSVKSVCRKQYNLEADSVVKNSVVLTSVPESDVVIQTVSQSVADMAPVVDKEISIASTITDVNACRTPSSVSNTDILLDEVCKLSVLVNQQGTILNELLRHSRALMAAECDKNLVPPTDLPKFPLNTHEQFDDFNEKLNDNVFRQYMITRLSAVGGSGLEGLTRRILRFLISDNIALKFNWKGRGEKESFERTRVASVIVEAAKLNFPNNEKNELVIADTIKCWLKYAPNRLKGKKE